MPSMTQDLEREQRRWERLALEGAVALDDTGRALGQVIQVSGGGVGVKLNADRRLDDWSDGRRVRLTVHESTADHTMTFRVRYLKQGVLGLEFASQSPQSESN